jgi:ABC-2 type transport system ATP-binding protein
MYFIKANQLTKNYGSRSIVKGINLSISQNEILAVIGPNGAGKSTTLEMLVGLRDLDSGEISYWEERFKEHIGVQLQAVPFFPGLTAEENLKIFAAFYKKDLSKMQVERLLSKCGLGESGLTEATKLSGGQQKRLAIAVALIHDPKLVFLDEPTSALDPRSRLEIHQLIQQLYDEGKTVVFTSHDMDEVLKLAHRVMMIDKGRVIAEGDPVQLCKKYDVVDLEKLYLKLTMEVEI